MHELHKLVIAAKESRLNNKRVPDCCVRVTAQLTLFSAISCFLGKRHMAEECQQLRKSTKYKYGRLLVLSPYCFTTLGSG